MLPKIISACKTPQTETEDSISDRDNIFEKRIIAFKTIVQFINSKFD
jgi:hypothetical protein